MGYECQGTVIFRCVFWYAYSACIISLATLGSGASQLFLALFYFGFGDTHCLLSSRATDVLLFWAGCEGDPLPVTWRDSSDTAALCVLRKHSSGQATENTLFVRAFGLRGDAHTHSEQSHQFCRKRTTITCCVMRANQCIIQRPNRSLFVIAEMMTIDPFKTLRSERSNAEE